MFANYRSSVYCCDLNNTEQSTGSAVINEVWFPVVIPRRDTPQTTVHSQQWQQRGKVLKEVWRQVEIICTLSLLLSPLSLSSSSAAAHNKYTIVSK